VPGDLISHPCWPSPMFRGNVSVNNKFSEFALKLSLIVVVSLDFLFPITAIALSIYFDNPTDIQKETISNCWDFFKLTLFATIAVFSPGILKNIIQESAQNSEKPHK